MANLTEQNARVNRTICEISRQHGELTLHDLKPKYILLGHEDYDEFMSSHMVRAWVTGEDAAGFPTIMFMGLEIVKVHRGRFLKVATE